MRLTKNRKKITPSLLVIVLGLLGWQIYETLGTAATSKTPAKIASNESLTHQNEINKLENNTKSVSKPSLSPTQHEYLHLMSEYQIAQIKRLIAKDYEEIAISNRNAARAMVETEKLSTVKGVANLPQPTPLAISDEEDKQQASSKKPAIVALPETKPEIDTSKKSTALIKKTLPNKSKLMTPTEELLIPATLLSQELHTIKQAKPVVVKKSAAVEVKSTVAHKQVTSNPKKTTHDSPIVEISRESKVEKLAAYKKVAKERQFTAEEAKLLKADPNDYAIQLMGNANISEIHSFLSKHKLQHSATYYKTYRYGHPWYVIIYKQFPNSQLAFQEVRDLPIELQRWSPFVKSFDQVQTELKKVG